MARANRNRNAVDVDAGGGSGSNRGGGRGRGRGGRDRGGAGASSTAAVDLLTSFILPPPLNDSSNPSFGRGRGCRGGAGGQSHTRGGRGGQTTGDRGRGRGRGGGEAVSAGTSMQQNELRLVKNTFHPATPKTSFENTLYPAIQGTYGGLGGCGDARGRGPPLESGKETYRRPTLPIGTGISPKGHPNASYRPVDHNGPLSSLLYRERPLLRPVIFVPSLHSRVLFKETEEEERRAAEQDQEMLAEIGHRDTNTHAPTADHVMRVVSGALYDPFSISSTEASSGDKDGDDIEEIEFSDMGRFMASLDVVNQNLQPELPQKGAKLALTGDVNEERFMGMYVAPKQSDLGHKIDGVIKEEIALAVEHMHVDGGVDVPNAEDEVGALTPSDAPPAGPSVDVPAVDIPTGIYQFQDQAQAREGEGGHQLPLEFIVDTEPSLSTLIPRPRIPAQPPLSNNMDDEGEVIVYVAPHPRQRSEGTAAARPMQQADFNLTFTPAATTTATNPKEQQKQAKADYTYAPYAGFLSGDAGASGEGTTFGAVPRRLTVAPLSTPRMTKSALAKQRKVAQHAKKREREGGGFGFVFGVSKAGFGGYGAMMQEKELRDDFGREGGKWESRRTGDSDLDWGDEDEEENHFEEEYMMLPELQILSDQEKGGKGEEEEGEEKHRVDGGEGGFTRYNSPASAKGNLVRKSLAVAGGPSQGNGSREVDAMSMDVDPELEMDVNAMRVFAAGMLGRDAGVHVTMSDLEDERRMREDDEEDDEGSTDDEGGDCDEDQEGEVDAAIEQEEDILAEDALSNEEGEDDDDDGEERTPRSSFAARLERLREQSRKPKGKGKARADGDDTTSDEDDFLERNLAWAEKEDAEELIQDILDENEEILQGRDRKCKNKLFKAIRNGHFNQYDDDFSFQPRGGKKAQRAAIPNELQTQWDKDRQTKAARKQQRELKKLITVAGPFSPNKGSKKGRKVTRAAARLADPEIISMHPNRIIDLSMLVQMLHRFVNDLGGKTMLSLPPTDKETRKNVHELAIAFGLKSLSKGKGEARYVSVVKTTRTGPGRVDERKVTRIMRRTAVAGSRGNDFNSGSNPYRGGGGFRGEGGPGGLPKHKEGEVVGKAAPRIDATNVGFRLLAMMGWSEGDRIGTEGLEDPVTAIIKHSKLGLGAT